MLFLQMLQMKPRGNQFDILLMKLLSHVAQTEIFGMMLSHFLRDFYLHRTFRKALPSAVIFNPFSAEHRYFPDWFLLVWKRRMFPDPTPLPSFVHVMFGVGFPVALHWNVTVVPSRTVWFEGSVVNIGGTAVNKMNSERTTDVTFSTADNSF